MRKYFTLFLFVLLFITSADAQIEKGNWLIGGTFGYGNSSSNGGSASNANITPQIGYAIGANSVLNARIGYARNASKNEWNDEKQINNSFSTGLSWKKFHMVKDKLGWYIDLNGAATWSKYQRKFPSTINDNESTGRGYSAGIYPGIYFMPAESLILNANMGGVNYNYSIFKNTGQPNSHNSSFNVNLFNYFSFGIDFIIGTKQHK